MNREDFGNLALVLFALFLIVSGITQLPVFLYVYHQSTVLYAYQSMIFVLSAITSMGLGVLIWVFSPALLKYIYRSNGMHVQPLDTNSVAITLMSVIGLYLLVTSLPEVVSVLFQASRPSAIALNAQPSVEPILGRNALSAIVRLGVGVFLAIRPGSILGLAMKLQGRSYREG